jgi:hypothetical protein
MFSWAKGSLVFMNLHGQRVGSPTGSFWVLVEGRIECGVQGQWETDSNRVPAFVTESFFHESP